MTYRLILLHVEVEREEDRLEKTGESLVIILHRFISKHSNHFSSLI